MKTIAKTTRLPQKLVKGLEYKAKKDDTIKINYEWFQVWNIVNQETVGQNLRGIDFSGANLGEADLCGFDLVKADLRGANLSEANLEGADLTKAKYNNATRWHDDFNPTAAGAINEDEPQ